MPARLLQRPATKKLAIFDIDGTIFRSSLLIELVRGLVREKIFKPDIEDTYRKAWGAWLDREGNYDTYIAGVVAAFQKNLKGVAYRDLRRVAYKVVTEHKSRTYRYTRNLVKELKAKRYYLVAISHSPKLAVEGFCKTLGFNKVYGIMYEMDKKEKFTGGVMFPELIFSKDKIVKRVLAGGGLTLRGSVGVGDSESDIAFLKLVDRAICFNPNKKLYQAARRRGWKVIVERKDVVYKDLKIF